MNESTAAPDGVPRLRVSGGADFVELVPYLVGFHPTDSLVLVALRGPRSEIGLTLRVDLPAVLASPAAVVTCLQHIARADADAAIVVVYDERAASQIASRLPHADLVYTIGAVLGRVGIGLRDGLLVADGRWWSYLCDNEVCCPAEGHLIDPARPPSPVLAAVTVAGMVAAPDREAVARALDPEPAADRVTVAERCVALTADRAAGRAEPPCWAAFLPVWSAALASQSTGERPLGDEEAASLLTGLAEIMIRDECCRWAGGPDAVAASAVLRQLARRAVPPWDAPPYALLGWFAWREGDGALARMAVERALVADPDCRFACLLLSMIDHGVDPRTWSDPPEPADLGGRGPV